MTFAEVILRYGDGTVDLTGWGLLVLLLLAAAIVRGGRP